MVILKFISIFFLTSIIYSIPDANVKALWIVRDHMTNPDLIDEALGFAENNGFNHIFAQVRGRGDSFYNSKRVLKKNRRFELEDSVYKYFIFIQDFKLKGASSPLEYVSSIVEKILINKRKKEIIHNIEQKLIKEAINNNNFEIYE